MGSNDSERHENTAQPMATEKQPAKMWSGRFRAAADPQFEAWQRSIGFDWRLLDEEIAASKAHASALHKAGILTDAESAELRGALDTIATAHRTAAGKEQVRTHPTAEDIHHFVELSLVERIGSLGLKLHTGRSRNEQIATDLRLYVRNQIEAVVESLAAWAESLIEQARAAGNAVMPSYTHLQRAEPVLVAHWMLTYVEMILRDAFASARLRNAAELLPARIGRSRRRNAQARPHDCRARAWDSLRQPPTAWTPPAIAISFSSIFRR